MKTIHFFPERAKNKKSKSKGADYIPAFTNSEDMAKFFSEEVQLGDDLLQIGTLSVLLEKFCVLYSFFL